jgi:hypothetical protein
VRFRSNSLAANLGFLVIGIKVVFRLYRLASTVWWDRRAQPTNLLVSGQGAGFPGGSTLCFSISTLVAIVEGRHRSLFPRVIIPPPPSPRLHTVLDLQRGQAKHAVVVHGNGERENA